MANSDYGAIPLTLAESTSEALNTKLGVTTGFKPSEWPSAIASIPTGGGGDTMPCLISSGQQAVELPIYDDGQYTFKFKLFCGAQEQTLILGGYWDVGALLFHTFQVNNEYVLYYYINTIPTSIPMKIGEWMDIELAPSYIKVDGVTYSGTFTQKYHNKTWLFGFNGGRYSSIAMSEMKIYDSNNDLVMDLEPREDNNGHGYYYDKVGDDNYYSSTAPLAYFELVLNN